MNLERNFSKELAGDLRKETASKLRETRNQPNNFADLKNTKELSADYNIWGELKEDFENLKKDIWGKIFKTEKYRELRNSIDGTLKIKKESEIKHIQEDYQKQFNKILSDCPLTPEEREKYLSTEAMEEMPLDDYLTLLKRLSGEAFYHVTRYGVRENTFTSTGGGHTLGEGELVDGFTPLLKDGNINSCTSTIISSEDRAKLFINKEFIEESKEKGLSVDEVVDKVINNYGTDYFLDRESTHFSYGKDLHHMYGGENNYKFYFYYPVEYILQNDFFFSTRETQLNIGNDYYHNKGGIEQQYNDFEIFNFGKGVPVNAGILCITGDTRVDAETGSQYVLKSGKPEQGEDGKFIKPEKTISSQEYWEKYFKLHPELKPTKIIYGNFSSRSFKKNLDLQELAKNKEIYRQEEDKKQEFDKYQKSSREELRKIFTEVVKDEFKD